MPKIGKKKKAKAATRSKEVRALDESVGIHLYNHDEENPRPLAERRMCPATRRDHLFQVLALPDAGHMSLERARQFWPSARVVDGLIEADEMPTYRCVFCGQCKPVDWVDAAELLDRMANPVPSTHALLHHIGGWAKGRLGGS